MFTDNCSVQFKCVAAFLGMCRLQRNWGVDVQYEHIYYGAERGKGVHDSAGGWLKALLRKYIRRIIETASEAMLKDAADCVAFLRTYTQTSTGSAVRDANRAVKDRSYHLPSVDVLNRTPPSSSRKYTGSRSLHHIRPARNQDATPGVLFGRELACTCGSCLEHQYDECFQIGGRGELAWQSKSLLQCGTELDLIEVPFYPVGSVVAIPAFGAAAGERPWQLLWVTVSPYVLRKKRTNDAFKTADDRPRAFEAGCCVVEGYFLQRCAKTGQDALVFELWDADWSRTGRVAPVHTRRHGAWSDRPTVMVEEDEVKVVDVVVEAVRDTATIARLGRAGHPGKLFALTVSEIDALDAACWEEEEGD